MRFPDVIAAVRAVIATEQLGTSYRRLTPEYRDDLPAFLVYRSGGSVDGAFREDRVTVECYGEGITSAQSRADDLMAALADTWHDTPAGLLDLVQVDTPPTEVPQYDGAMVQAVYRIQTRPREEA